jgi:MFS family permease
MYYAAYSPLTFLYGKIMQGIKEGTLWAVNRPFLLEQRTDHWRVLVQLRTVTYLAFAFGSLLVGYFVGMFQYEGTMLLCSFTGLFVLYFALSLKGEQKKKFSVEKVFSFLDIRKKERRFQLFLVMFILMGVSHGFQGGFIIPLFLNSHGYTAETIGLIISIQILLASIFSYLFVRRYKMTSLILLSGVLYSLTFFLLGMVPRLLAGILIIMLGVVRGIASVGEEGILSQIVNQESYGTDIAILMVGLHLGEAGSLAVSGFLISLWGFVTPFLLSASIYGTYIFASYILLKKMVT